MVASPRLSVHPHYRDLCFPPCQLCTDEAGLEGFYIGQRSVELSVCGQSQGAQKQSEERPPVRREERVVGGLA